MRVVAEALEELPHVLVHVGVERDVVHELVVFALCRELTVTKEPRHFEEGRAFGKLLDRVAAIAEDALVAVDECDRAATGSGVQKSRVVAQKARIVRVIGLYLFQIGGADCALADRNRVCLVGPRVADFERVLRRIYGRFHRACLRHAFSFRPQI